MSQLGKIYIAGPMRGYPEFNFPAFRVAAEEFRKRGFTVFSPHEDSEKAYGKDFSKKYPTGSGEDAEKDGFSIRNALANDLDWICQEADSIYMLRGWEKSRGAIAEHATAVALGHRIYYE